MMVKFKTREQGEYVTAWVLVGPDAGHLRAAGNLLMTIEEWRRFSAGLVKGADFEVACEERS